VCDVVEVVLRVHGAQHKRLMAQHAALLSGIHRLRAPAVSPFLSEGEPGGGGGSGGGGGGGSADGLQAAIDVRAQQLDQIAGRLQTLTQCVSELEEELRDQESLVAQHRAVVWEVTTAIDARIDAAQQTYQQALQQARQGLAGWIDAGSAEQNRVRQESLISPSSDLRNHKGESLL
jgi:hypothetical protein